MDLVPLNPRKRRQGAMDSNRVKRAIAIQSRIRSKYPYSSYGRAYFQRGSQQSLDMFGPTYKTASDEQKSNRKQLGYTGRGRYMGRGMYLGQGGFFGDLWDGLKDIGRTALTTVANPVGNLAGNLLSKGLMKLGGRGEYNVNSLIKSGGAAFEVPSFNVTPDMTSVTISHREYIGNLYGPPSANQFFNQTYAINPGLEKTFPWLSQLAANFDEYSMKQLMFTYRSTVSDFAATSGQVGQVIMATQYNAASKPFTDKAIMMQYDGAMSGKTSEHMLHGVECDPAKLSGHEGKYIRTSPVVPEQDVNTYDQGVFNIACSDIPSTYANQALGEIWVSYTVELRKPRFWTGRGYAISRDAFRWAVITGAPNVGMDNPFGDLTDYSKINIAQQNNIGCKITTQNSQTIPLGTPNVLVANGAPIGNATALGTEPIAFSITIPANYAGNLRLLLSINQSNSVLSTFYHVFAQGNVKPLKDILNPVSGELNECNAIASAGTLAEFVQIVDLNVNIANDGQDNIIYFTPVAPNIWTGDVTSSFLDIKELNSSFQTEQDGSNDAITWVWPTGTIVPL